MHLRLSLLWLITLVPVLPFTAPAQLSQDVQVSDAVVANLSSTNISERGPNSRVVSRVTALGTNASGESIFKTNRYTELASGMHRLVNGQWVEASEAIAITADGAAATNAAQKAFFTANINTAGAIRIVTPENKELRSHVIGLSYATPETNVLIAVPQDRVGVVVGSNQVYYTNSFAGVNCDLRYTYSRGSFEQDLIFREQLPSPTLWGLSTNSTRLQLWTEFENAPVPTLKELPGRKDQSISFGATKLGPGRAFLVGDEKHPVIVRKRWVVNPKNDRTCLLEEVELSAITSRLQSLPRKSGGGGTGAADGKEEQAQLLPGFPNELPPMPKLAQQGKETVTLAKAGSMPADGFVLDYFTVNETEANYTFHSGNTYYIPSAITLTGTTTIEPGAVLKFGDDSYWWWGLDIQGSLVCPNDPWRPAILTSEYDSSVGEDLWANSSGPSTPVTAQYVNYLWSDSPSLTSLSNLRFAYAYSGVTLYDAGEIDISNCQFLNCFYGIRSGILENVHLRNVLFGGLDTAIEFNYQQWAGIFLTAQQVTADCSTFWSDWGYQPGFYLANSIIVGAFTTPYTLHTSCVAINPGGTLFASFGADNYYLADTTYRNAGNTTANMIGLYHYTTAASQAKEADSVVDLGFHYLAVNANNNPIDTDGDGLADYFEDTNGNGLFEPSTDFSDWTTAHTLGNPLGDGWQIQYFGHLGVSAGADPDGDGVSNLVEYLEGRNPNSAGTIPDSMGAFISLRVF